MRGLARESATAFAIFLFRQFFQSIPDDLTDSARLDGMKASSIHSVAVDATGGDSFQHLFGRIALERSFLAAGSEPELDTPPLGVMYFRTSEAADRHVELMTAAIVTGSLVLAFMANGASYF